MKKIISATLLVFCLGVTGLYWVQSELNKNTLAANQAIQKAVDEVIEYENNKLHPKGISVIVANPKTGSVCALHGDTTRFLTEPVSTFKPFVVAAALETGKINESTKTDCNNGTFKCGNRTIKDYIPLGKLSYSEILQKSSNIGISKIALNLDDNDFYETARRFWVWGENGHFPLRRDSRTLEAPFKLGNGYKAPHGNWAKFGCNSHTNRYGLLCIGKWRKFDGSNCGKRKTTTHPAGLLGGNGSNAEKSDAIRCRRFRDRSLGICERSFRRWKLWNRPSDYTRGSLCSGAICGYVFRFFFLSKNLSL